MSSTFYAFAPPFVGHLLDRGRYNQDVVNEISAENLVNLNEVFSGNIVNSGLNIGNGGMTNGSRTDSRNSVMSAVADLLGAPSLIARSRPMKIIDQNGQEIEGTFMHYRLDLESIVTPEDLQKMQELSEKLEKAAEKYLKGKLGKGEKLEDYSPYTQGRIRTARTVVENAKKNKVIKSYEKNAAEVNAREARENLARRLGNQKEAQDIKKGRVKAPLQDAPKKGL